MQTRSFESRPGSSLQFREQACEFGCQQIIENNVLVARALLPAVKLYQWPGHFSQQSNFTSGQGTSPSSQTLPVAGGLPPSPQTLPVARAPSPSPQTLPVAGGLPPSPRTLPVAGGLPPSPRTLPVARALPPSPQTLPVATAIAMY